MVAATGVLPCLFILIPPPPRVPDSTLKLYEDCMNGFHHFLVFFTLSQTKGMKRVRRVLELTRQTGGQISHRSTKSELLLNYCFTGNRSENICGHCCSLLSTHVHAVVHAASQLTYQSMGVDYIEQRF